MTSSPLQLTRAETILLLSSTPREERSQGLDCLLFLDSVPTVLGTRYEEAEQPHHEQHCGYDPQHVQCEASPSKDEHNEQNKQDQAHVIGLLHIGICNASIRISPTARREQNSPSDDRHRCGIAE